MEAKPGPQEQRSCSLTPETCDRSCSINATRRPPMDKKQHNERPFARWPKSSTTCRRRRCAGRWPSSELRVGKSIPMIVPNDKRNLREQKAQTTSTAAAAAGTASTCLHHYHYQIPLPPPPPPPAHRHCRVQVRQTVSTLSTQIAMEFLTFWRRCFLLSKLESDRRSGAACPDVQLLLIHSVCAVR